MIKVLSIFIALTLSANAAEMTFTPNQIVGIGGAKVSVADGNASITPQAGGSTNVVSGIVYVPSILDFSTDVSGTVSASGHISLRNNGTTVQASINGAAYAALGSGGDALVANPLSQFASTTSAQLRSVLSDENGTGVALFDGATSPTFVTPALGTPSAIVLTNASGTVTNLTLVNPALGTPASGVVTNLTGTASININGTVGATTPTTGAFTTLTNTGAATNSKSGAASVAALTASGVPFAGTGTTSFPLVYINDASATASTTLSTAGTYLGVNGDGTQDLMNLLKDGTSQCKVDSSGNLTINGYLMVGGSQQVLDAGSSFRLKATSGLKLTTTTKYVGWTGSTDSNDALRTAITENASGVVEINNGTAGTLRDITLRNATASGTLSVTGASTLTGGIVGTTAGGNATAGNVGEYGSSSVVQGSATSLTTATPKTVASVTLAAGDYMLTGIGCSTGASTGTNFTVAIGTTTNSLTGTVLGDTQCQTPTVSLVGADASLMIPGMRVTISGSTTYYLIVSETYTVGTPAAYGRLSWERIR